jgi:DNA polymerase-1
MQIFDNPGGLECVVYAPAPATFDPVAFRLDFPLGGLYGLDFETTSLDKHLAHWHPDFRGRLVQFATKGYAWVLDITDPVMEAEARRLLADPSTFFASHSSMDVLTVWMVFGLDITDRNVDTLILAKLAAPDDKVGGADLKTVAIRYDMPGLKAAEVALEARKKELWCQHVDAVRADLKRQGLPTKGAITKTYGPEAKAWGWDNIPSTDPVYLMYAGLDAIVARRLVDLLIPDTQAPEELIRSELWMAAASARLTMKGYLVDQPLLRSLHGEAKEATDAADFLVMQYTGLKSTQNVKLVEWLGGQGVDWTKHPKTDKGAPTLAGEHLGKLMDQEKLTDLGRFAVAALMTVQQHADMLSKLEGVLHGLDADGLVHSKLNTLEAVTARMSSSGPNMQNFSPQTRGVFIARPGHVLISCDFDQVELRVVAGLAEEQVMIDAILRGDDLHQLTADLIGQPRKIGKMTNFLVVYGGGAGKLALSAGIPFELAQQVLSGFWSSYPCINQYNQALKMERREIRTFSQRRVPVAMLPNGEPKSYANLNYMIQSSARDLLARAWWELEHVHHRGHWAWLPIHDEMVLEIPVADVDEAIGVIQECMTMDFLGVPITATAEVLLDDKGVSRWRKG